MNTASYSNHNALSGLSVPFSAPRTNTGSKGDVILVDPGALPVDEVQRVPVGDGLWVLLLLVAVYAGVKKNRLNIFLR